MRIRSALPPLATLLAVVLVSRPAAAHVDYVTDGPGESIDAVAFALDVLSNPFNAAPDPSR